MSAIGATLAFAYDGLCRRVQKKTTKNGAAEMKGYLYDGWNVLMISTLDPANRAHLARKWSCVWRPDVGSRLYARGSWQAAGGVGGLAWLQTGLAQTATMYTYQSVSGNAEVHIPMMDHMGNVRHYYQIKATGPGASARPPPQSPAKSPPTSTTTPSAARSAPPEPKLPPQANHPASPQATRGSTCFRSILVPNSPTANLDSIITGTGSMIRWMGGG